MKEQVSSFLEKPTTVQFLVSKDYSLVAGMTTFWKSILTSLKKKLVKRLQSYYDPRPSANQSTTLKNGLTLWSVCFVLMYGWRDTITKYNEPLFKLVLWFVLGRGSKKRDRSTTTLGDMNSTSTIFQIFHSTVLLQKWKKTTILNKHVETFFWEKLQRKWNPVDLETLQNVTISLKYQKSSSFIFLLWDLSLYKH